MCFDTSVKYIRTASGLGLGCSHFKLASDGGFFTVLNPTLCCICFYFSLLSQDVRIQDRQVLLGSGFPAPSSVQILFEETFYNDQEQSYSILCISRPVELDTCPAEFSVPQPYCLKSVEDVKEFLGRHALKLDKFIQSFCQSFKEQERKGLRHHIVRKSHGLSLFLCRIPQGHRWDF